MARPKLGPGESERLQMVITTEELAAIDKWRYENRIPSKSEAIRRLVQIGLRFDDAVKPISDAGKGLARASNKLLNDFYLLPDRAPHLSDEEKRALRAYRTIMRKASDFIDAVAGADLQRMDLSDASQAISDALAAANKTKSLFYYDLPDSGDKL